MGILKKLTSLLKRAAKTVLSRQIQALKYAFHLVNVTLITAFIMLSVVFLTRWVLQIGGWWSVPPVFPSSPMFGLSLLELAALSLSIGILEEVMFRYLIMDCVMMRYIRFPFWLAAILSAALFGYVHIGNAVPGHIVFTLPQMIGAGVVGLWLAYLYKRVGLHMAILSHALYDFMCFALVFHISEHDVWLTPLVMGLGAILLILFFIRHLSHRKMLKSCR